MCLRLLLATTLWLSLILFHGSNASLVWELRKLVALNPEDNNVTANSALNGSPVPMPVHDDNKMDSNNVGDAESPAPSPLTKWGNERVSENVSSDKTDASSPAPVVSRRGGEKGGGEEGKMEGQGRVVSQFDTSESCDVLNVCTDLGGMIACISETGSKYIVVLIHNGEDNTIKVTIFMDSNLEDIEVAKHHTKKVNISLISSESIQLILNAGKGECVLPMDTKENIFVYPPKYDKILTPANGAYFLILVVLVLGGTCACCKFSRKQHDGVPYQELEMALPESFSAPDLETAEAWDQVWDDDWNEDAAVKSPAAHHSGSFSANGLTSRSSNRDGWEDNWDD